MRLLLIVISILSILGCNQKETENKTEREKIMKEKNLQLVHQYFDYFNKHNWTEMANMYIENAKFKDPTIGKEITTLTKNEIINKYTELSNIFPDINDKIINVYPSGDEYVIVEFISNGTDPEGNKFELPICTIFGFENGLITKDYSYFDNFE